MPDTFTALTADVGGTNTRVALTHDGAVADGTVRRFRNDAHDGLGAILGAFLTDADGPACHGACIAMAGPVMDGVGRLTNFGWTMDRAELSEVTGADVVAILNDLQAQGHALDHLAEGCVRQVVDGPTGDAHNAKLVIGVGTGFNAVPVFRTEMGRFVPPGEPGHAGLPVRTDEQLSLSRFVARSHGFPGVEDVLSGRGLERVYQWMSGDTAFVDAATIMESVDSDPVAERSVEVFVQTLGRVTGDLALTHLPFGGIYLIGGVVRAMVPHFERFGFAEAMRDKGRFSAFMERFAVFEVSDDYAALTGCARHLLTLPR